LARSTEEVHSVTSDDARNVATIVGVAIAALALVKGLYEYSQQGRQKRAEHFIAMRKRFKENAAFIELCDLLEDEDPKLAQMPFKQKRDFLGFFEEVAIMVNSRLLRPEVAHYMFGYYIIDCWRSDSFWQNLDRDSNYVSLFKNFALEMIAIEDAFTFVRRR
jgi:hypothetical protein